MSKQTTTSNNLEETPTVQGRQHFEIHVGDLAIPFDKAIVLASEILKKAGATPVEDFSLEALTKQRGDVDKTFKPSDEVDLSEKNRKFFRAIPHGGGKS